MINLLLFFLHLQLPSFLFEKKGGDKPPFKLIQITSSPIFSLKVEELLLYRKLNYLNTLAIRIRPNPTPIHHPVNRRPLTDTRICFMYFGLCRVSCYFVSVTPLEMGFTIDGFFNLGVGCWDQIWWVYLGVTNTTYGKVVTYYPYFSSSVILPYPLVGTYWVWVWFTPQRYTPPVQLLLIRVGYVNFN